MKAFPMEEADRLLRFGIRGHRDEGKAAGLARELILHERGVRDGAGFGEKILEVDFGGVEGKIPDVEFIGHSVVFLKQTRSVCGSVSEGRISNRHWNFRDQRPRYEHN